MVKGKCISTIKVGGGVFRASVSSRRLGTRDLTIHTKLRRCKLDSEVPIYYPIVQFNPVKGNLKQGAEFHIFHNESPSGKSGVSLQGPLTWASHPLMDPSLPQHHNENARLEANKALV